MKPKWINIYLVFVVLCIANAVALLTDGGPAPEADMLSLKLFGSAAGILWLAIVCFWIGTAYHGDAFLSKKGVWPSSYTARSLFFLAFTFMAVQKVTISDTTQLIPILGCISGAGASIYFAYEDHKQLTSVKRKA